MNKALRKKISESYAGATEEGPNGPSIWDLVWSVEALGNYEPDAWTDQCPFTMRRDIYAERPQDAPTTSGKGAILYEAAGSWCDGLGLAATLLVDGEDSTA